MSDRQAAIAAIRASDPYSLQLAAWRIRWLTTARPKQLPPATDWQTWQILAGRGFGKTRIGAEHSGYLAASSARTRHAVVGPTQNDVRSVCFEGESGLMNVIPQYFIRKYNSTDLELELINGSLLVGKSAEKPDRLRGPQFHGAWCDELASWGQSAAGARKKGKADRLQDTWDNLMFGLRLGTRPRVLITTTPRPLEFIRKLLKDPHCHTTTGSMFDNRANLAASALETMLRVYDGTRRGRQELYGEVLENIEGALWTLDLLDKCRVREVPGEVTFVRVVVAVDPAVTSEDQSDETGIIVAALGSDGLIYILADLSGKHPPHKWAKLVLAAYSKFEADAVIAETNQGGDLVEANLKAYAENEHFAFKKIHAKRGKYLRAEPVAAYYEKGKVRHVGRHIALESQMASFCGSTGDGSPDRLDALVYAIGELMLGTLRHDFW